MATAAWESAASRAAHRFRRCDPEASRMHLVSCLKRHLALPYEASGRTLPPCVRRLCSASSSDAQRPCRVPKLTERARACPPAGRTRRPPLLSKRLSGPVGPPLGVRGRQPCGAGRWERAKGVRPRVGLHTRAPRLGRDPRCIERERGVPVVPHGCESRPAAAPIHQQCGFPCRAGMFLMRISLK